MVENLPYTGVRVKQVEVDGKRLTGVEIYLPNAPPLIILRGEKGFAMCGYLDMSVVDELGLIAVKVTGVRSVEDMLEKPVSSVSAKARENGLREGLRVRDIINNL